jgi:hypothetical protein
MKLLPGVVLIVGVSLLTFYFWSNLLNRKEGFINQELIDNIIQTSANNPTQETPIDSTKAATYYRALLVFIKNDFPRGLKLVHDLNTRIYGHPTRIPDDFDPRSITDNYVNPIAGI